MNYKYNIVINQKAIVDNGLSIDIVDAAVFDFIKDFSHSDKCVKMQIDGKTYFWITNQTIIDNLPLLQISTPRGISKRIDNLVDAELLVRCPNNQEMNKTLYAFGRRYDEYIFTSESRPWNESSDLGTAVPTPWNDCSNDNNNNNKNNNISSSNIPTINNFDNTTKETDKESCNSEHKEIEELIYSWLMNDEQIRRLQFLRLGVIKKETTTEEFEALLRDYITKYYEKCRLDGEADIRERGHNRVMSHFNNWLSKFKRLQDYEKEKQDFTNQKPKKDGWSKQDFLAALNS